MSRFRWPLLAGCLGSLLATPASAEPRRTTLFLDFGGGRVPLVGVGGTNTCASGAFEFPMFLGSERASQIALEEARRILAPYGVAVVAEPPPDALPYTHVRIGSEPEALNKDPQINGESCVIDCADAQPRDTVYMYADKWISRVEIEPVAERELAVQIGRIAVHEAGHSWGLEHTGGSESVMSRFPSAIPPAFVDGCQPLDLDPDRPSQCPAEHAQHCDADAQDAHAELLAMFGPSGPDDQPPELTLVSPVDGVQVEPGATVTIEIEVDDDHGGVGWWLSVPELGWEHVPTDRAQTSVSLTVPAGVWTVRAEAVDHARNVRVVEAVIDARPLDEVDDEPPMAPTAQCACRAPGTEDGSPAWWLWLPLLLGRRRRYD